jgi:spore coat polysaccharide biosynthesis protein SpsF
MRVVAIIQARTGSTRLPGKVLLELAGEPVLARVVTRTRRARTLDEVVIATTTKPADDPIVEMCVTRGWSYFRGSEDDVLDRYYQAAIANRADLIVRITSDCPIIDPELIDSHVNRMLSRWHEVDFVTNMMRQTFPLGLAVEVLPLDVLARIHRMSKAAYLKEHVTTLAYDKPQWFEVDDVINDIDLSEMRWTVDTPEDLAFVRRIFGHFDNDRFSWRDVVLLLDRHPDWTEINRYIKQETT